MKVGTIETLPAAEDAKKPGASLVTNSGGGSGSGNGRNGGGGDGPDDNSSQHGTEFSTPNKSRILTVFLLLVVLMTFGGLIGSYIVLHTNGGAEWRPFDLPVQVWISTFLIVASSITYHIAKLAIDAENQITAKRYLLVTTVLGSAFIASQILAWFALVQRGLYMAGNPYAGFFYILTATHIVHVLGGIIALGVIVLKTWSPVASAADWKRRKELAETTGWYWHFVDGIWIVLFVMLGFWK